VGSEAIFKGLPAVGRLLDDPAMADAIATWGRPLVTELIRVELDRLRGRMRETPDATPVPTPPDIATAVALAASKLLAPSPRTVINATGVVAHTNLGRSVLSPSAARRVAEAATGYLDLEYDLASGERGDRNAPL